jgi:hypothetical protein
MHTPSVEECNDSKDSLYGELKQVVGQFPKYHTKITLGYFNAKVGRESNFKPAIGNESLHQDSNNNGVRIVKFATSKNLLLRAQFSRTETFMCTPAPLLMTDSQLDWSHIDR